MSTEQCFDLQSISDVETHIINERKAEMFQIEQNVSDLADIFADLSSLVNEQGEQLDIASNHVEMSEINTHESVTNLSVASDTATKIRKWLIGAGVTSAAVTITGAALTFVSIPIGLTAVGVGIVGVALSGALSRIN